MSAAPGGVAVVLGAGNQGFLTVVDMLDCLFVHRECVLVKHHPLRNYQDHMISDMFAPLIDRGFVATMLHTTIEAAASIVAHDLVTHVHMTGGKATHDAILWGSPSLSSVGAAALDRVRERKISAKMTSELGCVTPWIVLPAAFSDAELQHQPLPCGLQCHGVGRLGRMHCVLRQWHACTRPYHCSASPRR